MLFTDTFKDLHRLKQLLGLAIQRIHASGIGFSAEGDYKTSVSSAILMKMVEGKKGSTEFMENYTYDFKHGPVLGSHMFEVSESFAATKLPVARIM